MHCYECDVCDACSAGRCAQCDLCPCTMSHNDAKSIGAWSQPSSPTPSDLRAADVVPKEFEGIIDPDVIAQVLKIRTEHQHQIYYKIDDVCKMSDELLLIILQSIKDIEALRKEFADE